MSLNSLGPEKLMALALGQVRVKAYVEERLKVIGLTQQEACERSAVPESMVEKFLENFLSLDYGEKLRVIIQFGSLLGDPVRLGALSGVEFGGDDSSDDFWESDQASLEDLGFRRVDSDELKKRGVEFPTDGSPPDFEALKQALADMGIDWGYRV